MASKTLESSKEFGNSLYRAGKYERAIHVSSQCIVRHDRVSKDITPTKIQLGVLFNNRAQSYIKMNKFDTALRDLDWIINAFKEDPKPIFQEEMTLHACENNAAHDSFCHPDAIKICIKALGRRAKVFLEFGNSARAYGDYCALTSKPFNQTGYAHEMQLKLAKSLHPSPSVSVICDKITIKASIFPKKGWQQIKPAPFSKSLPMKGQHSMIRFGSDIYCVAGSTQPNLHVDESFWIRFIVILIQNIVLSLLCVT